MQFKNVKDLKGFNPKISEEAFVKPIEGRIMKIVKVLNVSAPQQVK